MNRCCVICGKWFVQRKLLPMEEFRPQVCEQDACLMKYLKREVVGSGHHPAIGRAVAPFTLHSGIRTFGAMLDTMRSSYERIFAMWMVRNGLLWRSDWWYEHYSFTLPHKTYKTYIPDFVLKNGVFIEVKGMWTAEGKAKVKLFRKAFSDPIVVLDAPIISRMRKGAS